MTDTTASEPTGDTAIELYRQAVAAAADAALSTEHSSALVPAGGADNAMAVKARFQGDFERVALARKKASELEAAARKAIEEKKRELDAMMRSMQEQLEPMQKQMARLQDGISAVNLYLGRDEELELIQDGRPALADTPLIVRQMVLYADEECAINAEDGGIDVRDLDAFKTWLVSDQANLDQVIPDQRAVVAMQTRRFEKKYEDKWEAAAMNSANVASWFLVRNGEKVWFMQNDFAVGARLTPARDEFTKLFINKITRKPMEPGSTAWIHAEQEADAKTRHFLKIALILQGLVDRTAVFHPLPSTGINLLTPDHYDAGIVRLIDDEFAITSNRIPFRDWLHERTRLAEVGERVIFGTFPDDEYDRRITPKEASGMSTLTAYPLVRSEGEDALFITFDRTDTIFDFNIREFRTPKTRGSYKLRRSDSNWLPLDRITIAEMEDYLGARTERHHYADMFPAMKAAIAFIRAEHEAERPFRTYLTGRLVSDAGLDITDAEAQIEDLIRWFKTANKWHRPLNGDPAAEQKAANLIVIEAKRRAGASSADEAILSLAKEQWPDAMFVGRATDTYVVIIPEERAFPNLSTDVFARRIDLTKTGKVKTDRRWQIIAHAQRSRWSQLHATDAWATWKFNVNAEDYATDEHARILVDWALTTSQEEGHDPLMATIRDVRPMYSDFGGPLDLSVTVWASGGEQLWDADHPLTRPTGRFQSLTRTYKFRFRKDGRSVTTTLHATDWKKETWDLPFNFLIDPVTDKDAVAPWSGHRSFTVDPKALIFKDDEAAAAEEERAGVWSKGRYRAAQLTQAVNGWLDSIEAAYVAELVEAERKRFTEDYGGNAELWEHHRATLKLRYPSSDLYDNRGYGGRMAPLRRAVSAAVETGADLDGLTVADIADEDALASIPADLHHLTFTRKDTAA